MPETVGTNADTGLVGRADLRAELCRVVDVVTRESGRLVLLAGEPGIGKTTLMADTATYARSLGCRTVSATCWEGDGVPGFWPWMQVLRAVTGSEAADLPGYLADPSGEAERFPVFVATAESLRGVSREQPLVITIDDLQWADEGSLRLLDFASRVLRDAKVLFLCAFRDVGLGDDHPLHAWLAGRVPDVLPVGGLETDDVRAMLGPGATAAVTEAVRRRTGGNPFFISQLTRAGIADSTHLPAAVGEVIRHRLALLPSQTRHPLEVAAVIGPQFRSSLVADALGSDAIDVEVALAEAVRSRILVVDPPDHAFAHDLFREYLYEDLSVKQRIRHHFAVASALGEGAPPGMLAHHSMLAVPLVDSGLAAHRCAAAATDADHRMAYEEAARAWGSALRLGGERPEWRLARADSLLRSGAGDEARAAYLALSRATDEPQLLAQAALGLQRAGDSSGSSHADTISVLTRALGMLPVDPPTAMAAKIRAALARELADGPARDIGRATALAGEGTAIASASGDRAAEALCLFAEHDIAWGPGSVDVRLDIANRMAEAAAAGGAQDLLFEARFARFVALIERADPQCAAALAEAEVVAQQLREPRPRYLVRSRRAALDLLAGRWAEGERRADEAFDLAQAIDEPDGMGVWGTQRICADLTRGGIGAWAASIDAAATDAGSSGLPPELEPIFRAARLADAGDAPAATAILRALPDPRDLAVFRWRILANVAFELEVATAVGAADVCRSRYEFLLPHAGDVVMIGGAVAMTGPVDFYLGIAAAACGRTEAAVSHLRTAAEMANRLGARPFVVRINVALAEALLAEGWVDDARSLCESAAALAAELEMTSYRDRARELCSTASAAPDGLGPGAWLHEGEVWRLRFAGREVVLKDAKGLRDISLLVSSPGTEIPATTLAGIPEDSGADEVLDDRAKAAYQRRLAELDDDIDDAMMANDLDRAAAAKVEREALVAELTRAFGLGGRSRRLGDSGERARTAVTARIRDTLRRVAKVHPELGEHLDAAITTGRTCCYRPSEPVHWQV